MKSKTAKLLSILLALVMMAGLLPLGQVVYAAGDVAIDATNFPDANFREFVKKYDTDSNGYLSETEIAAVGSMNCSGKNIADLTGIEHFTALLRLDCRGNNLTALDVSENTALEQLDCRGNNLTALDVSENTALKDLSCSNNQLTALDVSKNINLWILFCSNNQLTELDVSKNINLWQIECNNNNLTALDVSKNTDLKMLICTNNQLTELDVNTELASLICRDNHLISLDVSACTTLRTLYCYNNQLTELDMSNNTELEGLYCYNNNLTTLDVSNNTELEVLYCYGNNLTTLDVSAVPLLKDAVEKGTKDTSSSEYDKYSSSQGSLRVDKTVDIITEATYNVQITGGYRYSTDETAFTARENDTFSIHADVSAIPAGKYIAEFADEARSFSVTQPLVTMPAHDLDLKAVYADQEEQVIDVTSGQATVPVSLGHECPFIDSTGRNPFFKPVGTKIDLDGDGTADIEITELNDEANTVTFKRINPAAATLTQVLPGYRYKFVYQFGAPLTYSVSLDPTSVSLTAQEGYEEESVRQDITATSTGTGEVEFIMAGFKETAMYEQFGLMVGGMTATVYPKGGLTAGTYTAVVVIEDFEDRFEPLEVPVTFTVTAPPVPVTCTVTFKDGENTLSTATVNSGEKVTKPADPTKTGYTFNGWYADAALATAFDFDQPITANTTVYAKFTEDVVTPPATITYTVTGGGNSTWTKGSSAAVTITVKRSEDDANCLKHFQAVEIDGTALAASDYEAKSGSTVVTIKAAALEKLSAGKHTVTVKFDDGQTSTSLTVKAASGSADKPTSPNTGDESNMSLWMALAALSVAGLAGVVGFGKKRRVHR